MADGRWQMADGRWQMADGRWQMADGRWQMADGRWQIKKNEAANTYYCVRRIIFFKNFKSDIRNQKSYI
jgi:2-amino-4-hydroxy-6-hydroxymethyldihydropteridine diphosphokinase